MPSIKELLEQQFNKLVIAPKTRTKNLAHLHADFAEIVALLRNEDVFSAADLINRFKSCNIKAKDLDVDCDDLDSEAEKEDGYDRWAHQVFLILQDRRGIYADDYPFEVDSTSIKLIDSKSIQGKKKIYLILLLCANLDYFTKLQPILTTEFEQLSYSALKEFVSPKAQVRQFGKNSDYEGTAQEKIRALANDMMGIELNLRDFRKITGNQERGLDVVAWYPFSDQYSNFLSILGQCACGKEWYKKLSETKRFHNYFRFEKLKPVHALFVPGALFSKAVESDGDFFQSDEFDDVLFFERLRILKFISDENIINELDSNAVVDYVIEYEEDLV